MKDALARAGKLRARGKSDDALLEYGRVLELDGENLEALAGRGWCFLDLSQYRRAEASFQGALELDPRQADSLMGLAETYRYEGRQAEAVGLYERYLAVQPSGGYADAARNAIQSLKE